MSRPSAQYSATNTIDVLPQNLNYGEKPQAAVSKVYTAKIPSDRTSYTMGETITTYIPTKSATFLDSNASYFCFTLNIDNTGGTLSNVLRWDSAGAHSLFSYLGVDHGSNNLQICNFYNLVSKVLMAYASSNQRSSGINNILEGTSPGLFDVGNAIATNLANTGNDAKISINFKINLHSILGSFSPQYITLGEMVGSPLVLSMQLENDIKNCMIMTGFVGSVTITNAHYLASIINVNDNTYAEIKRRNGGLFQTSFSDFRSCATETFTSSSAGPSEVTVSLNARQSNVRALFACIRTSGSISEYTNYPFSCLNPKIASYQFMIGDEYLPKTAPSDYKEMVMEACKCFGNLGDELFTPKITDESVNRSSPTVIGNVGTESSGNFILGLDMDRFSSADRSKMHTGKYMASTTSILIINFNTDTAATLYRINCFVMYQATLKCQDGVAVVEM